MEVSNDANDTFRPSDELNFLSHRFCPSRHFRQSLVDKDDILISGDPGREIPPGGELDLEDIQKILIDIIEMISHLDLLAFVRRETGVDDATLDPCRKAGSLRYCYHLRMAKQFSPDHSGFGDSFRFPDGNDDDVLSVESESLVRNETQLAGDNEGADGEDDRSRELADDEKIPQTGAFSPRHREFPENPDWLEGREDQGRINA